MQTRFTWDIDQGIERILGQSNVKLVCTTMGRQGSKAYYKGECVGCEPFIQEDTIETTGAGDTFMACVLNTVVEKGLDALSTQDLYGMLRFANAAAFIITTKKGALKVMPNRQEIMEMIANRKEC